MSCCDQDHGHQHTTEEGTHANHEHQQMIEGQDEEEQLRLKKLRMEKRLKERQENKKKYLPLFKFLRNNGLKFKSAGAEKNSIEYFRMDHFRELLENKKEEIERDRNIAELLRNWEKIFIYYDRLENQPHFKWPQQLNVSKSGPQAKFASFPFDTSQNNKIKGILIMLAVIGLVLFPLWPLEFKVFIWYVSYYITMALVGIIILRLVLYVFFSIFGASVWLFPRLMDNVEVIQSFTPFYSAKRWEGSTIYSIATRIIIFSVFCYYGFHIYHDPQMVKENLDITKTIMDDINDWGLSKIKGEKNFSQSALSDYSKLLNSTLEQPLDEDEGEQVGEKEVLAGAQQAVDSIEF